MLEFRPPSFCYKNVRWAMSPLLLKTSAGLRRPAVTVMATQHAFRPDTRSNALSIFGQTICICGRSTSRQAFYLILSTEDTALVALAIDLQHHPRIRYGCPLRPIDNPDR